VAAVASKWVVVVGFLIVVVSPRVQRLATPGVVQVVECRLMWPVLVLGLLVGRPLAEGSVEWSRRKVP